MAKINCTVSHTNKKSSQKICLGPKFWPTKLVQTCFRIILRGKSSTMFSPGRLVKLFPGGRSGVVNTPAADAIHYVSETFARKSDLGAIFRAENWSLRKSSADHRDRPETFLGCSGDVHGPRRSIPGTYENRHFPISPEKKPYVEFRVDQTRHPASRIPPESME